MVAGVRTARTICLVALGVVAALAVAAGVAWGVDSHAHQGRVTRHVRLAGHDIGGAERARVTRIVDDLASRYGSTTVVVDAPGGGFRSDASAMGVTVDRAATVTAAFDVGRRGSFPHRLTAWISSLVSDRQAPVRVDVDGPAVRRTVLRLDPGPKTAPTEPSITLKLGHLIAVDGKSGTGVDPRRVARAIPAAAVSGRTVTIHAGRGEVAPRFTLADASRVAADAEVLVAKPLAVTAGAASAKLSTDVLRSLLVAAAGDDGLRVAVDADAVAKQLPSLLPNAGTAPVETTFTVVADAPQIVAGRPGTGCCAPEAAGVIERALMRRTTTPVDLPLKKVDPVLSADAAGALGIKEKVSTFTTNHACCAPRVQNIHRIADLVRGVVIKPGETFSVNSFVGPRTTAKGFVVDHVIEDGKFAESVGGGISQFGTTTFNAAFFAGLEMPEYMAHTIYISRYPYGREATLSYPHPDLKIKNVSPYGILIWPTYTGTSLTVSFYSTRWVTAAQTGQTTAPRGDCTAVRTQRTRTFLDGTTKVDHFTALYQPAEGVLCK